ncbi:PREDICTED: espin-like, partial [Amphimedon queenslandica]|uniref:Uncharacterized protein n=1 Tax=Amphimedon queenslandica TaxID=400682 RepID=A0AAN0IU75_AMPQE
MIRKMLEEGLESDEVIGKNDTLSSSSALQQFSEQFAFVRKYYNIKVNEGPKRQCRILSDNLSLNFDDDLIYKFENGKYDSAISSLLSFTNSEYLKTVRSKECNANLLHWAAYHGWIDIIDMLINDHGFDLVFTNTAGHTCVHYAVFGRKLETLKVLVTKHHCDPICKDSKGRTPLFISIARGYFDIIKYYMTSLGYDSCNGKPLGIVAARHGYLHALKYLIKECNFNASKSTCSENNTALDYAARHGHFKTVMYLVIECKCDPNEGCMKPLHHASQKGHIDIV